MISRLLLTTLGLLLGVHARATTLTQLSTIDSLMSGNYDGTMRFSELRPWGDFGLGTFDAFDGEMVALDGAFYQVKSDGHVYPVDDKQTAPFAVMTFFKAGQSAALTSGADYAAVERSIDALLPTINHFYAIRISGTFRAVKTRSVPRQVKPYPPADQVAPHQPTFDLNAVRGTMVGFFCPAFARGLNVPGYHLHFITQDRSAGGHVLRLVVEKATVEVSEITDWSVRLPDDAAFKHAKLDVDRQKQTRQVER